MELSGSLAVRYSTVSKPTKNPSISQPATQRLFFCFIFLFLVPSTHIVYLSILHISLFKSMIKGNKTESKVLNDQLKL